MSNDKLINIKHAHGYGDAATFAFTIPLYTRRGYKVEVETFPEYADIYRAGGAEIVEKAQREHTYGYPSVRPPLFPSTNPVEWNKIAHNLTAPPMPHIGTAADLWAELLQVKLSLKPFLTKQSKKDCDSFLKTVQGPLVLMHTRGRISPTHIRPFPPELEAEVMKGVLHGTDATILLLDFDDRVVRLNNRRVRHLTDDFRKLTVPEVAYLMERAALFLGIDSGPQHLTRFTNCPALVTWFGNHPSLHAIPRDLTANICDDRHRALNRARRHLNNIVDVPTITASVIAEKAAKILDGTVGRDLVVDHLLGKLRNNGVSLDTIGDRDKSLGIVFDFLRGKKNPRVLETGTIRSEDDWGAGYFTYVCGLLLEKLGGHLDSVDLNLINVAFSKKWTGMFGEAVTVHQSDSVKWLEGYTGEQFDVVYLDSQDTTVPGYERHCSKEAAAALPHLKSDGLIVIDDSPWVRGQWTGKGKTAIPELLASGFRIVYSGYQCVLRRGK